MQNFRPFHPCVLWQMPGTPKFDPFHYVKIVPKFERSTDRDHKLISSEDGQDTSTCKISGHSLHAFSGKYPETSPDGRTDGRMDMPQNGHGWSDGQTDQCAGGKRVFQASDGRTDGQPLNQKYHTINYKVFNSLRLNDTIWWRWSWLALD